MTEAAIGGPAYTVTARVLHWIVAAMVLFQVTAGIAVANEWTGSWQDQLYDLHKSVGATLVPIVLYRVYYRLTHSPAPLPIDLAPIQQFAAHATHYALYALIVIQPIIGWIGVSAYRAPIPFFGLFDLPPIWPVNRAFSEQLFVVHKYLGIAIAVVAAMHIAAALQHHFVRKDRVLMRMITG